MTTSNTKLQTGSCGGSLYFCDVTSIFLNSNRTGTCRTCTSHLAASVFILARKWIICHELFLWFPDVSLPSLSGTGQVVIYLPAASIPSLPSCNPTRYASPQRCLQTKWFAQCVQPMLSVMLTHILIVQLELNPLAYRKNERFDK